MASLSIPNLRTISGTAITVPANQTWVIKTVHSSIITGSNPNLQVVFNNGVSFSMKIGLKSGHDFLNAANGLIFGPSLVANAGDSFTATPSITLGYWILETDFNMSNLSIPDLRLGTLSRTTTGTSTLTVPANKTWILKFAHLGGSVTSGSFIITNSVIINGNTYNLSAIDANSIVGTSFCQGVSNTLILKAGDTINLINSSFGTIGSSLSIGYWILEDDF